MNPIDTVAMRKSFVGCPGILKLIDALERAGELDERTQTELTEHMNTTMLVQYGRLQPFLASSTALACLARVSCVAWEVTPTQIRNFDGMANMLVDIVARAVRTA